MSLLAKDQVAGKREQLLDVMIFSDLRQTVLLPRINKSKDLTNQYFRWTADKYADISTTPKVDGEDVTSFANHAENRAELSNYIHYLGNSYRVSRLAENTSTIAGVRSEVAEAKRKLVIEQSRNLEAQLLSDSEMAADNGATGYTTRALGKWIQATAQDTNPVPEHQRPTSGQIKTTAAASLSEEGDIQEILQAVYDATGMNGDFKMITGSEMRRALTTCTRIKTGDTNNYYTLRTFNQSGTKVQQTTTVYEGDFGSLEVLVSPFIGWSGGSADTDRCYFVDMSKLKLRYWKLPTVEEFEDRGGGTPIYCESTFGLECSTPRGMGKIVP